MSSAIDGKYSRGFVPTGADMGDWTQIEPLFDALDARSIEDLSLFERWILDGNELAACLSEEYNKRLVAMTCQTDDQACEQAYLYFVQEIQPRCKPRWHRLNERYVASPLRRQLPKPRYEVYDRGTVTAVELFREENVPLQTEEAKLDQQYQKICGAMTVEYNGREQTLQQMARYQQEPDRRVRQEAWELSARRRLADRGPIDDIFDQMIRLRTQIAQNAGFDNFRDYQFKAYERFDYTPADCYAFHEAIERVVVPVYREIQQQRRRQLGIEQLRPWDLSVDPKGRPPLRPFNEIGELSAKCRTIFARVDPVLGEQFDGMIKAGWLDLDSRKGKAPGGYQATFDESRHPFIFMNAVGLHRDVETLLHEGGHAFHCLACRDEPLLAYRHTSMEMAEVASMGMELLASDYLGEFYEGDDLVRARREQLEGIIGTFPWIAVIDAFQHWLYLHPGHTREQRTACWLDLLRRFGGIEEWTGYEATHESLWQRQLHLFGVPFYYIEYGIAQIGALQLWRNTREDKASALRRYREALTLGGSRPLPELWAAGGLTFDFRETTLRPLVQMVTDELHRFD
jgi:oligoendopeptidase F